MAGNMYPWVDKTRNFLAGACPHDCDYCYMKPMARHLPIIKERYSGEIRLIESEFLKKEGGKPKTIFIGSAFDIFAHGIPYTFIRRILKYCCQYPQHTYLFQTKYVLGMFPHVSHFPPNVIIAATIESNFVQGINRSPESVQLRARRLKVMKNMLAHRKCNVSSFMSIEPIMKFNFDKFIHLIDDAEPDFVSIGANTWRGIKLQEPSSGAIMGLISVLGEFTEVRLKDNLKRLIPDNWDQLMKLLGKEFL